MNTIKLPSFEIAVYEKGASDADKLMICLPGRLDTKDYAHMRSHVDYFGQRGYLAVSFDPPGTWESGSDINDYTTTNYLQVIRELITHYGNRKTVLLGHSRGGSMAMLGSDLIESVTHMIAIMSNVAPSVPSQSVIDAGVYIDTRDTPTQYQEEEITFHLPLNYFTDAEQYDFAQTIVNDKPKLFMYGSEDDLVTSDQVRVNYEQLATQPKEIYGLSCEHDYRKYPEIIDEVNQRVEKFLQEYSN